MTNYRCLLEIAVRHGYYAGEACEGLRFVPTPATRHLIERADGLVRVTPHGLVLLAAEDRAADWLRDGAGQDETLAWSIRSADSAFAECTAHSGRPRQEAMLFDASNATPDTATGYERLHAREVASTADRRLLVAAAEDGLFDPATLRENPCALVRVPLRSLAADAAQPARFLIRFAPCAAVWKYCLVGDWPEPGLHVVDLAQQVDFEPVPARRLADGRASLAFRSTAPIALHQRPEERFQLRSRATPPVDGAGARAGKVLVKRLPAAAPRHFSREVIGGASALVSEIFVHR